MSKIIDRLHLRQELAILNRLHMEWEEKYNTPTTLRDWVEWLSPPFAFAFGLLLGIVAFVVYIGG